MAERCQQPRWKQVRGPVLFGVFGSSVERVVDGELVNLVADTGVVNWLSVLNACMIKYQMRYSKCNVI